MTPRPRDEPHAPPQISERLKAPDRHRAILHYGEQAGLWTYIALVEGRYTILRPDGRIQTLDGLEVDQLAVEALAARPQHHPD